MTAPLADREEALFREWSVNRPSFVRDGVVDETAFLSTKPALLFLLKEVNDTKSGGGWDLRSFVKSGARPSTWTNVTRWVRGIRALPGHLPWASLSKISRADRVSTLASIAVMNLKKTPGTHTANSAQIKAAAISDTELLRRQFDLYQTDVVICCGSVVARGLHQLLQPDQPWRATSRGVRFLQYAPGRFAIEYCHPEARVPENLLYYGLIDAVREILH
jgi:hypothetical protein